MAINKIVDVKRPQYVQGFRIQDINPRKPKEKSQAIKQ